MGLWRHAATAGDLIIISVSVKNVTIDEFIVYFFAFCSHEL